MKSRKARATSAKRGLSARNSRVSPCTLSAPSSTSRCGFRYAWKCRGLMLRLRISTHPSSITRSPSLGFNPVVSVSSTICLALIGYPAVRQLVRPLVLGVAGMAPHPVPFHIVQGRQLVEPLPQVDILHRLLVGGAPAAALPVMHPFRDPLRHVQGIGIDLYSAWARQRLESADHRGELHAVIRGVGLAAIELALGAPGAQQHAPGARALRENTCRRRQSEAVLKPEITTWPSGISTRSTSRSTSCGLW